MSSSFAAPNRSTKNAKTGRKTNKIFFIAAILTAILAAGGVFWMFLGISDTQKYYVLTQDVPARTQITTDMLQEVVAPTGSVPPNALVLEYIAANDLFAAYPLYAGEVVSASAVAEQTPILADVPAGYVAASFSVPAENAVAGKVVRNDKIDIIASQGENMQTKVILRGVRVLDTASSLESVSDDGEAADAEGDSVRTGIPTTYTVALTPIDAVKLAAVRSFTLTVVLTDPSKEVDAEASVQLTLEDIFGDAPVGLSGGDPVEEAPATEETPAGEAPASDTPEGQETAPAGETPAANETGTTEGEIPVQ